MKKINSSFKAAFLTEPGAQLENNDYYACIELEDYACYVLADGITDESGIGAAQAAVETILSRFQENPSIKRQDIHAWLDEANEELLDTYQYNRLKASVMVVVTDYEKIRYGYAGNVRMRLFRNGRVIQSSVDMSLAQQMVDKEEIPQNALAKHVQRHNLSHYLGQDEGFKPYVSNKTPLRDGDIITMYTRGVWENIDEGEIVDLFGEASDKPQETLDTLEDMLLARQPMDLDNYTMVVVFVNETFKDPKRDERHRLYKKIAIIVIIILIIIGIIYAIWHYYRSNKIANMTELQQQSVMSIQHNNFKLGREQSTKALELAESLKNSEMTSMLNGYISLIDSISQADEAYKAKDYSNAYLLYEDAMDNSRASENLAAPYIARRMTDVEKHLSVTNLIAMGDNYMQNKDLTKAEAKYMEAQAKALTSGDPTSQQLANAALMKFNETYSKAKQEEADKNKLAQINKLNDLLVMAQTCMDSGNLDGCEAKLKEAQILAGQCGDDASRQAVLTAYQQLITQRSQLAKLNDADIAIADQLVQKGDTALTAGDLANAKLMYTAALDKYNVLGDDTGAMVANMKLQALGDALLSAEKSGKDLDSIEKQAAKAYETKDYIKAKALYAQLAEKSKKAGEDEKAQEALKMIDKIDTDMAIMDLQKTDKKR